MHDGGRSDAGLERIIVSVPAFAGLVTGLVFDRFGDDLRTERVAVVIRRARRREGIFIFIVGKEGYEQGRKAYPMRGPEGNPKGDSGLATACRPLP